MALYFAATGARALTITGVISFTVRHRQEAVPPAPVNVSCSICRSKKPSRPSAAKETMQRLFDRVAIVPAWTRAVDYCELLHVPR